MSDKQMEDAKYIARTITDELGGYGLFGIELFLSRIKCILARCLRDRMIPAWLRW